MKETIMRNKPWLVLLLLLSSTSALGANYLVGIGDDCAHGPRACFAPQSLTITAGDTVTFFTYTDLIDTGPHNIAADDGSFRCAEGCDGQGGDGSPAFFTSFTRVFNTAGIIPYHDDASHAAGVIVVQAASPAAPTFAIGPGISGAWFDPFESGQGILVEVLPGNRFLAWWLSFNPAGTGQSWFGGVGTYTGNVASITDVVQPIGPTRFIPNFTPWLIAPASWGTLTFTFTDCNNGRVDYSSRLGYGNGTMNLVRITQTAGLTCP
jgi:plastocyanin